MIHIENLVKRYGDLIALDHLNLDIKEGECESKSWATVFFHIWNLTVACVEVKRRGL